MTAIANANTTPRVEVVVAWQMLPPLIAAEAIVAGAPCRIDTNGKAANGNGTDATESNIRGIATRTVAAGEAVTLMKSGILDGFTFTQAYTAPIYVSDTDATLADAAGTVSKIVGYVVPGNAQTLGTAADKLLLVDL